ncbi:MAG: B12-binding domain-containing radical SAM protein [Candidatus Eisenbacteria sp.]|nr:B12-binding domain-containing radical SAM protein [Candidatus Eisenbacteria bacterium]
MPEQSAGGDVPRRQVRRVLLIHPPIRIARESLKFCQMPLGVSYLAAYIRDRYEVAVLDASADGYEHEEDDINGFFRYGLSMDAIAERIRAFTPDVVGISCPFSPTYPVVEEIATLAKKIDSRIVTIVGGNHPTFLAEECFARPAGDDIDYIVLGEGEQRLRELLTAIETGASLAELDGLAYRRDGSIVVQPMTTSIMDVDGIPFPARDLMPMKRYAEINVPHIVFAHGCSSTSFFTGRGCPSRCTFCSSTIFWGVQKRLRNRSPENVLDEIGECIEKYGIDEFHIEDDNFTADVPRAKAILQGILDRGYKIRWSAPNGLAVWTLDEELVRLMKASGVSEIVLAFESGSQEVLTKIMHKPLKLEDAVEKVRIVQKYDIRHNALFMIGLPGETMAQIHQTIDFVKSLRLEAANLFAFFPLPGTPAYETCKAQGYIPEDFNFTQNSSTRGRGGEY